MSLMIKAKHIQISAETEDYIEKKTNKFNRFLPKIDEVRVDINPEKTNGREERVVVEVTVRSDGKILRAEDRNRELRTAVDVAVDKLNRQIARFKGKRIDRWHANQSIRYNSITNEDIPPISEDELDILAEETNRQIVRVKQFSVTPMNQEEALEQMQLLDHDFFVFYNADVGRMNVLYKRGDQNYGLLDPVAA